MILKYLYFLLIPGIMLGACARTVETQGPEIKKEELRILGDSQLRFGVPDNGGLPSTVAYDSVSNTFTFQMSEPGMLSQVFEIDLINEGENTLVIQNFKCSCLVGGRVGFRIEPQASVGFRLSPACKFGGDVHKGTGVFVVQGYERPNLFNYVLKQ